MKKYLITEAMLHKLQNLAMPRHLMEELDELKPIEPLDNPAIKTIMTANGFKTYPEVGDDLKPYCYAAVRAIERHILGGETP